MSFTFKKRVAFGFVMATSAIMAIVFGVIYLIVYQTVYRNIDNDLSFEAYKHTEEITFAPNGLRFKNKDEWNESEHREVEVNPVFIQLTDTAGIALDKSPNLKLNQLKFSKSSNVHNHFNTYLSKKLVRQIQIPVEQNGELKGYIVTAMSLDNSLMVLKNLRNTLLFLYPVVLLGLFLLSSMIAGKSIAPVLTIIEKTNQITSHNLEDRIALPKNKDELYVLSQSINSLLQRIENSLERERQFTGDASHELRTPIAVIRGTLEVLNRKERTVEEYREKIAFCLVELDRMTNTLDNLLTLARLENSVEQQERMDVSLREIIQQSINHRQTIVQQKELQIAIQDADHIRVREDETMVFLILDNLMSNAIKYSNHGGEIKVQIQQEDTGKIVTIVDQGIGIRDEDLSRVMQPFFRSDQLNHKEIKGVGLGLSIAKKAADTIGAVLGIQSKLNKGTRIEVKFK